MPRYPDVHVRLGNVLAGTGRVAEAIKHYDEALEINPLYVQARVSLGFAHLRTGDHAAAHAAFLEAQDARETLSRRKLDEATAALSRGERDVARDLYKDAFHEDLSFFEQLFSRGMTHLRNEAWEDAVDVLGQAADLCPRFADVHNYLGVALAEQEHLDAAIRAFKASVAINREYIVAWLNMAYVAWQLENEELARRSLEEVLSREPDNAPAQHLQEQLDAAARGSVSSRAPAASARRKSSRTAQD